ncbi:hypothetical protein EDB89DRAFT_1968662 [Lactarius sanguifluus]|nr:hypothetical protein EDB89DRAFT_2017140 [Lactarius sanguifluus]KAH9171794.1 hypothetical protein EDB89DRAFT_1968662 [Lactarius sanguifluus]
MVTSALLLPVIRSALLASTLLASLVTSTSAPQSSGLRDGSLTGHRCYRTFAQVGFPTLLSVDTTTLLVWNRASEL